MVYPPIPLWFAKWIMAPSAIIVGLIFCCFAYMKGPDTRPFRIRDLFRRISMREETKQQLLIEGIFLICLGIVVFAMF